MSSACSVLRLSRPKFMERFTVSVKVSCREAVDFVFFQESVSKTDYIAG
jgi:hypothetical protein